MHTIKTRLLRSFGRVLLNYFMLLEENNLSYLQYIHLMQQRIKLCENEIKNNGFASSDWKWYVQVQYAGL
jgi:hypothetical protein